MHYAYATLGSTRVHASPCKIKSLKCYREPVIVSASWARSTNYQARRYVWHWWDKNFSVSIMAFSDGHNTETDRYITTFTCYKP